MTDEQTLARLRASDMSPGEFLAELESLEATQEMLLPPPAREVDEVRKLRDERDVWRFSCVTCWVLFTLVLLALWGIA